MHLKQKTMKLLPWVAVLGIAVVLRLTLLFGIGTLWADEAFSWHFARKPFMEMLNLLKFDVHPPFHAVVLWGWIKLFGDTAFVMRLLSFFTAIAGLVTFKLLGLKLFGKRVAMLALIMAALSPLMIYYAVDGRMYALVFFLSSLSGLAFWEYLHGNRHAKEFWFYASLALVMTHITGALVIAAQGAFLIFSREQREQFKYLLPRFLAMAALFAVWFVPAAIHKLQMIGSEWQFQAGEQAVGIHHALAYWIWISPSTGLMTTTAIVAGLFVFGGILRHSKRKPHFNLSDRGVFLLWWLLFTTVPFVLVGATVTPRYIVAAIPAFFLLIAHGFLNVARRKWYAMGMAGLIIVFISVPGIAAQLSIRSYNWDRNVAWIEERFEEGDRIVFGWYANVLPFDAAGGFDGQLKEVPHFAFYPFDDNLSEDERYIAHAGTLMVSEEDFDRMTPYFEGATRIFFIPNFFLRLEDGSSAGPAFNTWLEERGWFLLEHKPNDGRSVGVWLLTQK